MLSRPHKCSSVEALSSSNRICCSSPELAGQQAATYQLGSWWTVPSAMPSPTAVSSTEKKARCNIEKFVDISGFVDYWTGTRRRWASASLQFLRESTPSISSLHLTYPTTSSSPGPVLRVSLPRRGTGLSSQTNYQGHSPYSNKPTDFCPPFLQ